MRRKGVVSRFSREDRSVGDRQATYSAPAAACAADVLHALKGTSGALTLAQLERILPRSKSLIFRVLRELETHELVARDPMGRYRLGIEAFELGGAYLSQLAYVDVVRQALEQLAAETGDTVNLGMLRGPDVLYLMKFQGESAYVTISRVGGRVPASCVAIGKALLAHLPDSELRRRLHDPLPKMTDRSVATIDELIADLAAPRATGHAIDREQAALGRCAVAVAGGHIEPGGELTAISVSTSASDFDDKFDLLLGKLIQTRDAIERDRTTRQAIAGTGVPNRSDWSLPAGQQTDA